MTEVETRVIDTNVAIGLTIKRHDLHEKSWEYTVEQSATVYLPPTAGDEFDNLKPDIEGEIQNQLSKHQGEALAKYGDKENLIRDDLCDLKQNFIDDGWDIAEFLRTYYDCLIKDFRVKPERIEFDLGNIINGVGDDPCSEYGGWRNVVDKWTRGVDSYPNLKSNLLIYEGDDPDICVEAHHIATTQDGRTELGSADGDFLDHKKIEDDEDDDEYEPRPRRDDIIDQTALCDVIDLRPDNW